MNDQNSIQVHITNVLPPKTGVSKSSGKPYTIFQYIGSTVEQYSRNILFTQFVGEPLPQDRNAWGTRGCPVPNINDDVEIFFELETREFQRRDGSVAYDTHVKPCRVDILSDQTAQPQQAFQQPQFAMPQQPVVPAFPQPSSAQPAYSQPAFAQPAPVPNASASGNFPPQPSDDVPF